MSSTGLRDYGSLITLPTQRKLFSLFAGRHQGRRTGNSHELRELDQYRAGDEVKSIDWKSTARNHQPVVKRFEATAQLRVDLLVDGSKTMGACAPSGTPKLEVATEIATALGWVATNQSELYGAVIAGGSLRRFFPARTGLPHAQDIISAVQNFAAQGQSQLPAMLQYCAQKPRSLLFVVTDFSALTAQLLGTLTRISVTHHPYVFLIEDADPTALDASAEDMDFGVLPEFTRKDMSIADQWHAFDAHRREYVGYLLRHRHIPYASIGAKDQVLSALLQVLQEGQCA